MSFYGPTAGLFGYDEISRAVGCGADFCAVNRICGDPRMSDSKLRVLIVDDHQLVAEVLATHLKVLGEIEAEMAPSLHKAIEMARAAGGYDVVLLDLWMPGADGLNGLRKMIAANMGKPVALLSGNLPSATIKEAMRVGAASCISKTLPAKSLINAIRFVSTGEAFLPLQPDSTESDGERLQRLMSDRERRVLDGLLQGLTNKEIGRVNSMAEVTVKMHVRSICAKLKVKNRTQAALVAQNAGVISASEG